MKKMMMLFAAILLVSGMSVFAAAQVVNPRITTDSSIDCSSAEAVVRQITKPDMTDEQKAVACWKFMLGHFYHWYPPKEENVPEQVRDFAKAINSYGFGPCFLNAPVLSALWEAAGLETRSWTITGHSIPEVKYGGAWHMLDGDARAWHRKADGQIASVEELAADAKLITDPAEKSDPFYPFAAPEVVARPLEPWGPPGKMMDLYLSRKDNYRYNRRAVMGHPMYLTLRPAEKLTLKRENEGQWYVFGDMPSNAVNSGPIDVSKTITYANGHLLWPVDLKRITADQILWLGSSNVKLADGKISLEKEGVPGVAVLRTWSPYVLVQAKIALTCVGATPPKVELSCDSGAAWSDLPAVWTPAQPDQQTALISLSKEIAGRYEYLLRITMDSGALAGASFDSTLQHAPLALPQLKVGANKVTIQRGLDEGVVQLVLGNSRESKARYIVDKAGFAEPLKSIQPAAYQEPAFVVYKLTAPQPLTALSIGANVTMDVGTNQHIAASYSLDNGKTWTEVWRIADNANSHNSQFEMDRRVTVENPAGVKEALVKYDLRRNAKYFAVAGVRLYAFYRQPQPADAGLNVTITWQEKTGSVWAEKKHSVVADKFPYAFDLTCGGESVRLSELALMAP